MLCQRIKGHDNDRQIISGNKHDAEDHESWSMTSNFDDRDS